MGTLRAATLGLPLVFLAAACGGGTSDSGSANSAAVSAGEPGNGSGASANAAGAGQPAANAAKELRLAGNGLSAGAEEQIAFGQPKDQVLAAVAAIRGAATKAGRNEECPSGTVDFAEFGPLTLHFEEGRFTGWVLDGAATPAIQSRSGLGIGDRRRQILGPDQEPVKVEQSSLGEEFQVEEIGGLLSGGGEDARVSTLFAGTTCFAR